MQNTLLQPDSRDNVLIALGDLRKVDHIAFSNSSPLLSSDVPAKILAALWRALFARNSWRVLSSRQDYTIRNRSSLTRNC